MEIQTFKMPGPGADDCFSFDNLGFDIVTSPKTFKELEECGVVDSYFLLGIKVAGHKFVPPDTLFGMTEKGREEIKRLKETEREIDDGRLV